MKKLLFVLLFVFMFLPVGVFAQGKVNVYVFRGDGCPHCEEFNNYIHSLDNYEDKIMVQDYEVWNNEKNDEMMKLIALMRKEENGAEGVPYIIIGNKSWFGYSSEMNKEIEDQINKVYNQDVSQRYDVMKEYNKNKDDLSIEDYEEYYNDYSYDDEEDEDDYYYDCEDEGYVTEDTMVGAAILAFIAGLAVAGIPLLIIIIIFGILLFSKKRNG